MEDNNLYLELFKETSLKNISDEEKDMIKLKLWILLGKITERYTMGDSSSVPIEIAEELLKSICFLLKREINNPEVLSKLLKDEELEGLFKNFYCDMEDDIKRCKELLEEVIRNSTGIENISYNDTVIEIGKGLKVYDYSFFAHEIPCSIDYQISNPVSEELKGIDFLNEYLKRLLFENKFCNNFNKENIIGILNSYCSDYNGLLINIFEPVLTNAIGLEILEDNIFKLEMKRYERQVLLYTLKKMTIDEIREELIKACENICFKLKINIDFEISYIKETALNLIPRIEEGIKNNNLENIFLSFNFEESEASSIFIDNENMDDEKLRSLIDEVRSCRFIKDKITIIRNEAQSLDDLVEILNNCIWEDEVEELVNTLGRDTVELLKCYLNNKLNDNISNTGWENKFKIYVGNLN